jgi:hypothetical protein
MAAAETSAVAASAKRLRPMIQGQVSAERPTERFVRVCFTGSGGSDPLEKLGGDQDVVDRTDGRSGSRVPAIASIYPETATILRSLRAAAAAVRFRRTVSSVSAGRRRHFGAGQPSARRRRWRRRDGIHCAEDRAVDGKVLAGAVELSAFRRTSSSD